MPCGDLVPDGGQGRIRVLRLSQPVDEVETGARDGEQHAFLRVAPGQGVGDDVCGARLVLHDEVETQQFPNPVVLRNCGQTLIQGKFQAVVVSTHLKPATPEIWPLVANRLDKPNQLPLVGGEGTVTRSNRAAEESHWLLFLQEHGAEPVSGRVALDGEVLHEVGEAQHRCQHDGELEGLESRRGFLCLEEPLLAQ